MPAHSNTTATRERRIFMRAPVLATVQYISARLTDATGAVVGHNGYGCPMKLLTLAALSVGLGFSQDNDCSSLDACQKILQANPRESLAHYRIGEILLQDKNYPRAANHFREALIGNLDPSWIEVWSHLELGKIF